MLMAADPYDSRGVKVIQVHAIKACGEVEAYLHLFLISAQNLCEWSALPPRKESLLHFAYRAGWAPEISPHAF
jgi:hypothetical protein